jgi:hypothetical protein
MLIRELTEPDFTNIRASNFKDALAAVKAAAAQAGLSRNARAITDMGRAQVFTGNQIAVRVAQMDKAYDDFAKWVGVNNSNPHLPNIHAHYQWGRHGETITVMENLTPLNKSMGDELFAAFVEFSKAYSNKNFKWAKQTIHQHYPEFMPTMQKIDAWRKSAGYKADYAKLSNYMQRRGTPVIIDPVS